MLTNFKAKVIPFFSQLQKAYQLTDLKNPALLVKEKPLITTALFHTQKCMRILMQTLSAAILTI